MLVTRFSGVKIGSKSGYKIILSCKNVAFLHSLHSPALNLLSISPCFLFLLPLALKQALCRRVLGSVDSRIIYVISHWTRGLLEQCQVLLLDRTAYCIHVIPHAHQKGVRNKSSRPTHAKKITCQSTVRLKADLIFLP